MWLLTAFAMIPLLAPQAEVASPTAAEESPSQTEQTDILSPDAAGREGDIESQENEESLKKRVEELEALVQQLAERDTQLQDHVDGLEISMFEQQEVQSPDKLIDIFGYFDVEFVKYFVDKDSMMHGLLPVNTTFMMQNVNLYFSSHISETLSALIELHFTFLPLGNETINDSLEVERQETGVTDALTGEYHKLGGVAVERAYLEWKPFDFFGVVVGRFLTPYGIWNVEHGSPVLIAARVPFLVTQRFLPSKQTGLKFFGRFFFLPRLSFHYQFTLSNGRGPIDAVYDLDENKGLGLRLKLDYAGKHLKLAIGCYGYVGDYTDTAKEVESFDPFYIRSDIVDKHTEKVLSADLKLQFFGVILQMEYIGTLNQYKVRAKRQPQFGPGYWPDHYEMAGYMLLAYELPLERWLKNMRIMPYGAVEFVSYDDTFPKQIGLDYFWGLNFKPTPRVTLKAEGFRVKAEGEVQNFAFWGAVGQVAVSF